MLTSMLYSIRVWSPLEISTILLAVLVILTLMLPIETRGKAEE
jgi:heme exporter protein D